ncbi:MAG: c-type cytochrome [Nitrospirota bacterium]
MKKSIVSVLLIGAGAVSFLLSGCGGGDTYPSTNPPAQNLVGVAAAGAPIMGTVTLKDSSMPAKIVYTTTHSDGSYQFQVQGLQPPFIIKVVSTASPTTDQLYSLAAQHGRVNVNPFSHASVGAASGGDPKDLYDGADPDRYRTTADNLERVIKQLRIVLAPLFALYQTSMNPVSDDFHADHTGMDALFDDVSIKMSAGTVVVKNKQTGGVIFTGPVKDLASGTFYPENMPGGSAQADGATLYAGNCSSCHGSLAASSKKGATAAAIQAAIAANTGGMGSLSSLTALQIQAIATALASATPPPPASVDGAALYASNCSSCHGTLAASSKKGATASAIQSAITNNRGGMGSLSTLTAEQIAAISAALATTSPPTPTACTYTYDVWGTCQSDGTQTRNVLTSTPAGCAGTPAVSRSCTYTPPSPAACTYTYTAWGACQSDNTQTRTVATSSPAGCVGIPLLTQSCTYVPPVTACTSFTYSAWGACQSDNTQTRTQLTASPAGCTGGTPVLSQSCTYVPPAQTCGTCHGIPPATGQHAFHYPSRVSSCSTCHGAGYSPTAVTAATHMDGVTNVVSTLNFNATTKTCGSPGCHASRVW